MRSHGPEHRGPLAALGLLAALALRPFFAGRFTFHLDHVVGPSWQSMDPWLYGFRAPVYGGSFPLRWAIASVAEVVGGGTAQSIVVGGVVVTLALVPYVVTAGSREQKLYAATLLLFNPFVYARLLAGHWMLLVGLAALPAVLVTVRGYLDRGEPRNLLLAVLAVTVLGVSAHLLLAGSLLIGFLVLFKCIEARAISPLRRVATIATVAVPVNAYWLGPLLLSKDPALASVAASDVVTYAPEVDTLTALLSVATMHGFWRGDVVYAGDLFPPVTSLYVAVLFLAVLGFVANRRHPDRGYVVRAVGVTAVVATLLGAGVQGPADPLFRWAFEHVPLFAGMRDSQKFVALLALAYAYLGALGLGDLAGHLRSLDLDGVARPAVSLGPLDPSETRYDRGQILAVAAVVLAVLTPVAYTFPMVTGYAGQVSSQDYPPEWYEVADYLDDQPGDGAVLFLPWHQYMDYSWLEGRQRRVATPARVFFDRPVIQGDNVEVPGTYTTSTNPVSRYVEFLFGLGPEGERKSVDNMGELLTHVDVEYVLVTKEVDWRRYDAVLRNQSDLALVEENERFRVYRNERDVGRAYATDEVRYVADWEEFVERSRAEDTTGAVYVVDEARAGSTNGTVAREPVNSTEVHPARYDLEGTDAEYTVFTQRQATHADSWRYGGREPAYRHLGISPVFASERDGGSVVHGPFYRVNVPSYAVSGLSLLVLVVHVGLVRRDRRRTGTDGRSGE